MFYFCNRLLTSFIEYQRFFIFSICIFHILFHLVLYIFHIIQCFYSNRLLSIFKKTPILTLIVLPHDAYVSPEKSFKAIREFFFCNTIIHKIFNANQILNRNPLLPLKMQTSHSSLCRIWLFPLYMQSLHPGLCKICPSVCAESALFLAICKISSPGFTCDDYKLSHK